MKDGERRALTVTVTRTLVAKALDDPVAMRHFTRFGVADLENAVADILFYLERTAKK